MPFLSFFSILLFYKGVILAVLDLESVSFAFSLCFPTSSFTTFSQQSGDAPTQARKNRKPVMIETTVNDSP